MKTFLARFRGCEKGAISVDWVVLTAGAVGLLLAVMGTLGSDAKQKTTDTSAFIGDRDTF